MFGIETLGDFALEEFFAVSAIVNGITSVVIGIVVLTSNIRSLSIKVFFAYMSAVAVWSTGYFFWMNADSKEGAMYWLVLLNIGSAFIPITYYHWIAIILKRKRGLVIRAGYIAAFLCAFLSFSPLYVEGVHQISGFNFWPIAGRLYILYIALYLFCSFAGIIEVFSALRKKGSPEVDQRMLYYLLVVLILGLFATTNFPLWYGVEILPFGNLFVFLHVFSLGYAMFRHDLMHLESVFPRLAISFISVGAFLNILTSETLPQLLLRIFILLIVGFFSIMFLRTFNQVQEEKKKVQELAKRLSETNWELSRSNEQLRIIDQRKSEFVSIASHQLRTPVTAIKGYASLLLENSYGELNTQVREPISKIFTSAQRLVEMINDFLNISKIEQGTMTYFFAPTDIKKLVTDLVQDFHVAAGEKKLDLKAELPEDNGYIAQADEGKIRQIVSNLIDNAIKYTPKGSVRVSLEKDTNRGEHGFILVKIKDTGVGLSHDDLNHLFGKFTRGSEGQKLNTSGSGLGLYIAKKMLEAHKGNIWVDSEGQGKGSVFCVELPISDGQLQKSS